MADKNKIYLCLHNSNVISAGNTLAKLVNNTFELIANNNYYFYNRKLKSADEYEFVINGSVYKIIRFYYAK